MGECFVGGRGDSGRLESFTGTVAENSKQTTVSMSWTAVLSLSSTYDNFIFSAVCSKCNMHTANAIITELDTEIQSDQKGLWGDADTVKFKVVNEDGFYKLKVIKLSDNHGFSVYATAIGW